MTDRLTFEELVERQVKRDLPYDPPLAYIDLVMHDGSERTEGPYSKWVADQMLGSGAFISTDVYSAVIRPVQTYEGFISDD